MVDDEPTVRMLITDLLQEMGHASIEAGDGTTAMKLLAATTTIDLLVTDVGLPGGLNGRTLADAARITRPDLKVLFINGDAGNAVGDHGHLDAGMPIVTEPFAIEAFGLRIRSLIEH